MSLTTKNKYWRFAVAGLCLVACSCGGNSNTSPASIMPLAVGNRWTYLEIHNTDSGVDTTSSLLELTQLVDVGEYEYFLSNTDLAFSWNPQGLSVAIVDGFDFDGFEALLLYPSPGRSYQYSSTRTSSLDLYIVVTEDHVDTPAGSFDAIGYRILRDDNRAFLFSMSFAHGVGYVRMVNAFGTTWLMTSAELVDEVPNSPLQPAAAPQE